MFHIIGRLNGSLACLVSPEVKRSDFKFPDADRLLFRAAHSVWIMQVAGRTIANSA
jgi:hypothetical protein